MDIFGYLAGVLTVIGFMPQTLKTIRTRETKDLSLPSFAIIGSSSILWTVFGFSSHKPALWITNIIVVICTFIIVAIKMLNKD